MKYCRFMYGGLTRYGAVEKRLGALKITALTEAPEEDLGFKLENRRYYMGLGIRTHAVERGGSAAAGHALEDYLRWAQLSRARARDGQRDSRRTTALFQAAFVAAASGRSGAPARGVAARGL